jgi:hypothetical protein
MTVLGDRLRVLLTQEASSVEELCQQHPGEIAAMAKILAQQAEAAAHRHLELQHKQHRKKERRNQEKLLVNYMTGLVRLLCCSSQQMHCAVVSHLARLAYCAPVLEQVTFPLSQYPAAITSVVNLLRGHMCAPDSTSGDSAATGPPPTLQAEAAAALVVLASLGPGSKELVGYHPDVIRGLAEAIVDPPVQQYWSAAAPTASTDTPEQPTAANSHQEQQPQPQQSPKMGRRSSARQAAARGRLVPLWVIIWVCVSALVCGLLVVRCTTHMCTTHSRRRPLQAVTGSLLGDLCTRGAAHGDGSCTAPGTAVAGSGQDPTALAGPSFAAGGVAVLGRVAIVVTQAGAP